MTADDYRVDLWNEAVETVDRRYGYCIEFSHAPAHHRWDYQEEYDRLMGAAASPSDPERAT